MAEPIPLRPPLGLEALARAAQDPTRRGILTRLVDDPRPRTVDEVAAEAGVHRTVAFTHLEQLVRLGLLEVDKRRGRPGKPANLYRATGAVIAVQHPQRRFDLLAGALASAVESFGAGGLDRAARAGRSLGEALAPAEAAGVADALRALRVAGVTVEQHGDELVAEPCVFREACTGEHVACHVQAGMLEGVLCACGHDVRVSPLGTTPSDRGCRYAVAPRG